MRGRRASRAGIAGLFAAVLWTASATVAAALSLTTFVDTTTGVQIGIPAELVGEPITEQWGRNWRAANGRISIDTINFGNEPLDERYQKVIGKPRRTLTRNEKTENHFVVRGRDTGVKKGEDSLFYVEMFAAGGELRGISVVYSASAEKELEPAVKAVIASFQAFPKPILTQAKAAPPEDRVAEDREKSLRERDRQIGELNRKIEERDRELRALSSKVAVLESRPSTADREKELQAERNTLSRERDSLRRQRDDMRRERDEAVSRQAELEKRVADLQKRLDEVSKAGSASRRLALVIGIDRYSNLPKNRQLSRAVNDSEAMAQALRDLGFLVTKRANPDLQEFYDTVKDFAASIRPDDVAVVFYAGHGVSIAGGNFLLPSDVKSPGANAEARLRSMSVAESDVIAELQRKARVTILIIDACRDNPFREPGMVRSTGGDQGLSRSVEAQGIFAIYSAGYGQSALDSLGPHDKSRCSVFTRSLTGHLYRSHMLHLGDIMIDVRQDVARQAETIGYQQYPAFYDQTRGGRIFLGQTPPSGRAMGGGTC